MAATRDSAGEPSPAGWDPGRLADTPLGHELGELCRRILGSGPAAGEAAAAALAEPFGDRLEAITRAAIECRRREGSSVPLLPLGARSMREAVGLELAQATAALPERQREALALRELLRLSYVQIGVVMTLEAPAVASLLARARTSLGEELRGRSPGGGAPCVERERALRVLVRRQDSEPVGVGDTAWVFAHMADCHGCERVHAVMLEASFRYRAWVRH